MFFVICFDAFINGLLVVVCCVVSIGIFFVLGSQYVFFLFFFLFCFHYCDSLVLLVPRSLLGFFVVCCVIVIEIVFVAVSCVYFLLMILLPRIIIFLWLYPPSIDRPMWIC